MNFSSVTPRGRSKAPPKLSTQAFEALDEQALALYQKPDSPARYRLKLAKDGKGVEVVAVADKSKPSFKLRRASGNPAQQCVASYLQTSRLYQAGQAQAAWKAVLALPHEFDHKALHQALRSVSKAQKRAWLQDTATQLLSCTAQLAQNPHAFAQIQRPGGVAIDASDAVQSALSEWCQAFEFEWLSLQNEQAQGLIGLWQALFLTQFGGHTLTAPVTPTSLRVLVINDPKNLLFEKQGEIDTLAAYFRQ